MVQLPQPVDPTPYPDSQQGNSQDPWLWCPKISTSCGIHGHTKLLSSTDNFSKCEVFLEMCLFEYVWVEIAETLEKLA